MPSAVAQPARRRFLRALAPALVAMAAVPATAAPGTAALDGRRLRHLLLLGLARAGQRIVAVGERGTVIYSEDRGGSWLAAATSGPALTTAYFVDAATGWAAGHDAAIAHSRDGGISWTWQHNAADARGPLLDLQMHDRDRGIAVGANGLILRTDNGGGTWTRLDAGFDNHHLYGIAWLSVERLAMVGERGLIAVSSDAGRRWRTVTSPYPGSLFGLAATADAGLVGYGMRGKILRSGDGGTTWSEIVSPTAAFLIGSDVAADGSLWLAGSAGTLLCSRDHGRSFTAIATGGNGQLTDVLIGDGGDIVLAGEHGPLRLAPPVA